MRRTTGRWAGAALMLLAAATAAAGDDSSVARPDLLLLWSDPERSVPDGVRRNLVRETEALFRGWGVTLATSMEDLAAGPVRQVRVVLLDQARLRRASRVILGKTHATPLELPVVWVLVRNVRAMVAEVDRGATGFVLARALARVAAHEILHALAPGLGHASTGLMSSSLSGDDLTRSRVRVDDAFRWALLEAVRQPPERQAALERP